MSAPRRSSRRRAATQCCRPPARSARPARPRRLSPQAPVQHYVGGNVPGTVRAYRWLRGSGPASTGHALTVPGGAARQFRAMSPTLAWVLGGAVLALAVVAVVLTALIGQLSIGIPAGVVVVLTFAAVGLLIARRQPGIPRSRWPPPRWPQRRCSLRCGGECSRRWTGGSTGPATTQTRP